MKRLRVALAAGILRSLCWVGARVRAESSPRPRGARMFVCLFVCVMGLALLFTSPIGATSPPPDPIEISGGTIIFYPARYHGWETFTVTRLHSGNLQLYANEARIFQDATVRGQMIDGRPVTIRFVEISAEPTLRYSPAGAAKGFRNLSSIRRYPVLEHGSSSNHGQLEVRSNGNGSYLITIEHVGVSR